MAVSVEGSFGQEGMMVSTCRRFIAIAGVFVVAGAVTAHTTLLAQTSSSAAGQVTFTRDVAPILQKSCQNCHRPGAIAPISLITYEDARPWARSIKQKVSAREMPPWHIDRNIGITKFKDDPSLTEKE